MHPGILVAGDNLIRRLHFTMAQAAAVLRAGGVFFWGDILAV